MKVLISVLTILAFAFGSYFYIENRYALSQELEKTKQRLEYKIISDQFLATQQRMWQIEDRFQSKKMDTTTKEELRNLEVQKEQLKNKMEKMEEVK